MKSVQSECYTECQAQVGAIHVSLRVSGCSGCPAPRRSPRVAVQPPSARARNRCEGMETEECCDSKMVEVESKNPI